MKHKLRLDFRSLLPRLPAFLFLLVVGLFIGWWVVRSAAVNSLARAFPLAAERMISWDPIAPRDPRVVAGVVDFDLRTRMGMARTTTKQKARGALTLAPLMEEPFLLDGIDALVKRDNRRARQLISHALARNGRSRLARLFMLELQLRARDAEGAAANMTILGRLMPDAQRVFVPELARLARDPDTRDAMREVLATDPRMLGAVLQHLAVNGADPATVLRLAGDQGAEAVDETTDWRRTLLASMVQKGDVRRARQLWSRFSGVDPEQAQALVYDASFEGLPGLPPFNWTLSSSELGAAERDKSGALFVEYYGRTAGELAGQLITLTPGRYRLAFHAEGDLDTPQHRLIWKVQCRSKGEELLLELPIANVTYAGKVLAGSFAVPRNCPAQWLRLVGQPTEFPKIENVLIREVRIERIGPA